MTASLIAAHSHAPEQYLLLTCAQSPAHVLIPHRLHHSIRRMTMGSTNQYILTDYFFDLIL